MFNFKNEKGLTLIELLITISVLAVVSAIALPVINNVVTSSNSNALQQSIKDADAFIKKYSASGVVLYDGLKTLTGYVDTDGDNVIEAGEKMDSLTIDDKYSLSVTGSAQIGGSYTNGGVTSAIITASTSSNSSTNPSASPSPSATTPAITTTTYVAGTSDSYSWAWKNGGPVFTGGARSLQIIDVSQVMADRLMAMNVGDTISLDGVPYTLADGTGAGSKGFLQIDIAWPNGAYRYGMIYLIGPDWGDNGYIYNLTF